MRDQQTNATNNQTALAGQASSTTASHKPATKLAAAYALGKLHGFIGQAQLSVFDQMRHSEECQFFYDKSVELAGIVETMPVTYETDGQGDQAIAHLHYFHPSGADWYITERDCESAQHQAFGLAVVWEEELGYISIVELLQNGAELDLHWSPKTLSQAKVERQMQDVNYVGHPSHY